MRLCELRTCHYAENFGVYGQQWLALDSKANVTTGPIPPGHSYHEDRQANHPSARRAVRRFNNLMIVRALLTSFRSALGGHTATVFGATGFLGRYIVQRLAKTGCTVIVPFREEMAKRHLKPTGDLGRVQFLV